ncbi:MAG: hybrid sensor histidine kinase/response regulator [Anaerolineaceae bacterium]|nr:hybrid sensor histidine kinase/response regulator [Anaerolineaceae bacterium]
MNKKLKEEERALVLVVDDNDLNADLLAHRLLDRGHGVMVAQNGRIALDMLAEHPIDIILLDIMMPELTGFELLAILKADPKLQYIPVIIISAADEVPNIVKGIELGAEDYLPKPFNMALLSARIKASLARKRLYDQEQARLQEIATLQAIDAELNATLDMRRVMEISLNWALRQVGGEAGVMGTLAEDRLHVLASQGYTYEIYEDSPFVLLDQLPAAQQALHLGELAYEPQTERAGLLARTQSQVVLPLYRETAVIALLVLESTQPNQWQPDDLAFLKRLGNHAAIALANAQLVDAMKVANQAKSEFVSFVSHELKIPMTSIKGYADLLLSGNFGPINEAQTTFLETIRNNVNRMSRLVSDLTDVSRLESGQLHLETRPIQLAEVVDEVASSTRAQIEEKQQTLVLIVPDNLPDVWADRTRLAQILTNLVSNAYKYTPEHGRITICAEEMNSVNEDAEVQPMIHVSVADTGLGIKDEEQKAIFNKFFRGSDDEALRSPGTGLGLNITKNLVELHDGRIWFESKYREGTTFHFIIPVANGHLS